MLTALPVPRCSVTRSQLQQSWGLQKRGESPSISQGAHRARRTWGWGQGDERLSKGSSGVWTRARGPSPETLAPPLLSVLPALPLLSGLNAS